MLSSFNACPTQVVFWDLRVELLEGLYRHNVGEARLQPILDILDATLGGLVEASVPVSAVLLFVVLWVNLSTI